MKEGYNISSEAVKNIENFIVEFEQSHTTPNQVFMPEFIFLEIKKEFPYLIEGCYYNNGKYKLQIVLTVETQKVFGVSFSYYTEDLERDSFDVQDRSITSEI